MIVLSPADLHARLLRRIVLGAMLGAGLTFLATRPTPIVIDPRMEKACRWPKLEGETTVGIVLNGKLICFVNR